MTVSWPTGPEAIVVLESWCAAHGVTLWKLGAACTPPVNRSTLGRWRRGREPSRAVWDRLHARMATWQDVTLDALLNGG